MDLTQAGIPLAKRARRGGYAGCGSRVGKRSVNFHGARNRAPPDPTAASRRARISGPWWFRFHLVARRRGGPFPLGPQPQFTRSALGGPPRRRATKLNSAQASRLRWLRHLRFGCEQVLPTASRLRPLYRPTTLRPLTNLFTPSLSSAASGDSDAAARVGISADRRSLREAKSLERCAIAPRQPPLRSVVVRALARRANGAGPPLNTGGNLLRLYGKDSLSIVSRQWCWRLPCPLVASGDSDATTRNGATRLCRAAPPLRLSVLSYSRWPSFARPTSIPRSQ